MTFRVLSAHRARRKRGQEGFTLVELLVTVTILPLVVGAISVAVLAIFNNTSSTANSLTSSGDAQISSTRFVQDVQSADWVTTDNNLSFICAGQSGTLILSLSPDSGASSSITNIISYVKVANSSGNTYTIFREACTGGGGSSSSGRTIVVSHNAVSTTAATISPVGGATQTAAATGWAAASGSSGITLSLIEPANKASAAPTSTYSYTMTAVPRITGTGGASPSGSVPILPMEFVGGTCVDSSLTLNGSTINVVNQGGFVGTTAPASSCSGDTQESGLESAYPYNYGLTNPFLTLQAPTTPSTSGMGAGSCSGTSTVTCTSGLYAANSTGFNDGSLGSNTTFNPLTPPKSGVVVFSVPVVINGDTNVTFSGGSSLSSVTYYFEQGLTIKSSTVNFGAATYIFGPDSGGNLFTADTHSTIDATAGSNGLIFYGLPGTGTMSIASGFTGNVFSPPTPYEGIVLWDAASGTLQLGSGNGGGGGATFNGGVYAPLAPISLKGGYALSASFLVINNATLAGSNGTITGTG